MKVALTSASGFIGSHIRTELEEHGHEVTLLGRDEVDLYARPTLVRLLGSLVAAITRQARGTKPALSSTPRSLTQR